MLSRTWLALLPIALGCADVIGLDQYGAGGATSSTTSTNAGGTIGAGGTTSTGGAMGGGGGATSTGGGGATSTGGTGGATSTGGGGATATGCALGDVQSCYDGPDGTEGIGACTAGTSTCDAAGAWGPCEGAHGPTREQCGTVDVDENCDHIATCTGQYRWAKLFGDNDTTSESPGAVAVDSHDNLVVAGSFTGQVDLGGGMLTSAGLQDVLVAKFGPGGEHIWSKGYGDAAVQTTRSVVIDAADAVILIGFFNGTLTIGADVLTSKGGEDIYVAKLDSDGNPLWAKAFGGTLNDEGQAVAVDAAGDVYITGFYQNTIDIGATTLPATLNDGDNVFVAKLEGTTGAPAWAKAFGGTKTEGRGIAVAGGDLYLGVDAVGLVSFGVPCATFGDGGGGDALVAKLAAADGTCVWNRRYGDATLQSVMQVRPGGDTGVVIAAEVRGTVKFGATDSVGDASLDVAVWKLDAAGNFLWAKRAGAAGSPQIAYGLATDPDGYVVVAGSYAVTLDLSDDGSGFLTATTGADRFVVKLAPDGTHVWSRSYPNSNGFVTYAAIDSLGRVDLTGNLKGPTDLGGGDLGQPGGAAFHLLVGQLAP